MQHQKWATSLKTSNLETHVKDSVEAHKLRPATLADSEDESEGDVESDATNDTKDLPDTPSDIIYMISDEEGLGVTTHRSEGNPSERAQTRYYQPSGIHSSEKRIELCGDICKEYGKDVVGKKELSYSTSAEASNLNSPVKRTRCSHAETMNKGYRTETEKEYASPETDWLTPTDCQEWV